MKRTLNSNTITLEARVKRLKIIEPDSRKLDVLVSEKLDVLVSEKLDVLVSEKLDILVSEKLDVLVSEKLDKLLAKEKINNSDKYFYIN